MRKYKVVIDGLNEETAYRLQEVINMLFYRYKDGGVKAYCSESEPDNMEQS